MKRTIKQRIKNVGMGLAAIVAGAGLVGTSGCSEFHYPLFRGVNATRQEIHGAKIGRLADKLIKEEAPFIDDGIMYGLMKDRASLYAAHGINGNKRYFEDHEEKTSEKTKKHDT